MKPENKIEKRKRRHRRVRGKIKGVVQTPRLCVFRSNQHIYGKLIDDENSITMAAVSDLELQEKGKKSSAKKKESVKVEGEGGKVEELTGKKAISFKVGELMAQKAKKMKIEKVVFDRGGYKYHGRVKWFAEGSRKGGLKF